MLGKALTTAAAGNAAGEALYVEDVFSTYLYTGTDPSNQTITNGIDLDGEGGLVWIKDRSTAYDHALYDTERGIYKYLESNQTGAEVSNTTHLRAFNSDGFDIGVNLQINSSGDDYASWTFRKAPKFFDVVTYTGTGSDQTISHNLGSVPGCIIIKRTDGSYSWYVWHRGIHSVSSETNNLFLNQTAGDSNFGAVWIDAVGSSSFTIKGGYSATNGSSGSYVAYLFAHNDGDGEFGENGDQDIIKCGSFTSSGQEIDLGFEPQWLLVKATNTTNNWAMFDTMRGLTTGTGSNARLRANTSDVEGTNTSYGVTSTGFVDNLSNSNTYIYIAIRRGPMKTPESGTEVFAMDEGDATDLGIKTGILTDALILGQRSGSDKYYFGSRLTGTKYLRTNTTAAEATQANQVWDRMDGAWDNNLSSYTGWGFRRAPGFFDVVAYTGNSTANRAVSHNLKVVPELIITKCRSSAKDWAVYTPEGQGFLNTTNSLLDSSSRGYSTTVAFTDTDYYLHTTDLTNESPETYIAYLFASAPGVSKVGSYTGNGTSQTIDCGFSTGARFVLIKRTDSTGDWHVYDSERGIVAGNDPRLELNTTDAEDTGSDDIDPVSSGFAVTSNADVNTNSAEYIFLAIA